MPVLEDHYRRRRSRVVLLWHIDPIVAAGIGEDGADVLKVEYVALWDARLAL
jgi:hypothetical protein